MSVYTFVKSLERSLKEDDIQTAELSKLPKTDDRVTDIIHLDNYIAVSVPFNEDFLFYCHSNRGVYFKDPLDRYSPAWFFEAQKEKEIRDFLKHRCSIVLDSDPDKCLEEEKFKFTGKVLSSYPSITPAEMFEALKVLSEKTQGFYLSYNKKTLYIKAPLESSFTKDAVRCYGIYLGAIEAWAFNYEVYKNELGIAYRKFLNEKGRKQ